jgi:lipoyl(octanoyl) transferase
MKIKNKSIIIKDLGVVDYKECWDFQEELFKNVVDVKIKNRREALNKPTSNYLLIC